MTPHISFRPEAEEEALATCRFYEGRRQGLGKEFAAAVDEAIRRLTANPLSFPRVHGEVRRAVLRRFPYAVYFRIQRQDIVVLAVHGRQHPARWQAR